MACGASGVVAGVSVEPWRALAGRGSVASGGVGSRVGSAAVLCTGTYRFVSARSLANSTNARKLAEHLHEQHGFTLQGVHLWPSRDRSQSSRSF